MFCDHCVGTRIVWFRSEDALVGLDSGANGGVVGGVVKVSFCVFTVMIVP